MDKEGLLNMLRARIDKTIVEVLFEIQHAVYYQFSEANGTWNKGEIEGPLILVKRNQEPHYCLIILNKQHHNSFYQQITSETLFEKKHPQLLCVRDKNKNVHGIWSSHFENIEHLFKKLLEIQHIDSQSRLLKNLLDIGNENNGPESILDPRPLDFGKQFFCEEILKPEFFQRGVVFEDRNESNVEREKVKEMVICMANSDLFLDLVLQALRAKGVNISTY